MKRFYVIIYDVEYYCFKEKPEVHVFNSPALAKSLVVLRISEIRSRPDWAKIRFRIQVGWSYKNPEDGSIPPLNGVKYFGYRRNDNNEIVSYVEEVQR